jgi:hypothetical protein
MGALKPGDVALTGVHKVLSQSPGEDRPFLDGRGSG